MSSTTNHYCPDPEKCRIHTTPTPIDPADIRPGDVVEIREVVTVVEAASDYGPVVRNDGATQRTWLLVHRPDPDAEAVEALARTVYGVLPEDLDDYDRENMSAALAALRGSGWDVVRRAES